MLHLALPFLMLAMPPAHAAGPEAGSETPMGTSADDELAEAKRAYLLREHERAQRLFESLVARANIQGDVPFEIEASALIFLGEIHLLAGDRKAAERAFRSVLVRDLGFQVSPYDHPTDVLWTFQSVRETIERERSQIVPSAPKKYPWWGFAPMGVPQFQQKKPVRGAVYAVLQTGFAAASVAAWVVIDDLQRDIADNADVVGEDPARQRAILVRNAVATPSAAAFYVTWAVSVGDGAISWRRSQKAPPPTVSAVPREGGGMVIISGRF